MRSPFHGATAAQLSALARDLSTGRVAAPFIAGRMARSTMR